MALKQLLVLLNQSEGVDLRLQLAIDLASRHRSHLTALFVDEWNDLQMQSRATAELGLGSARALEAVDRVVGAEIGRAATRLRGELESAHGKCALDAEWAHVERFSKAAIQSFLPFTDLCILGHQGASGESGPDSVLCESLLMSFDTPILFIPKSVSVLTLARRVVVAWDGSRAAIRAVNAAMPLIERADHTLVVNVAMQNSAPPLDSVRRLTDRLRRHCVAVDSVQIEKTSGAVADILCAKAHEVGADLIVCGAFGHSRLKENLFGGVTRHLLDRSRLPLLLSH